MEDVDDVPETLAVLVVTPDWGSPITNGVPVRAETAMLPHTIPGAALVAGVSAIVAASVQESAE